MRYKKFPPAAELEPFVECYFVWEGEASERTEIQSAPNCFGAIVFNYGDAYQAFQNSSSLQSVPKAFACGLFTSNYHLVMKGTIGIFGIVPKASALHNFFLFPMSNLVNSRMPLKFLLGAMANQLWNEIKVQTSDESRNDILERFALSHLAEARSRLSVIDDAVEFIDEKKGCVSVDAVAEYLGIIRRYLEKKFLEKVSVSSKFYAQIKRFGILSNHIAHHEKIDWQELVFEYGFHDQSHLVKEFMKSTR